MLNQELKHLLYEKNIKSLYHANTVATTCTFLKAGGLLSRGTVEDLGLKQTPQKSDDTDKIFDVYYDIFFDSDDIHRRAKRINYYGPVLFVYSTDLLDDLPEKCIAITKENPQYWKEEMEENERYFMSLEELGESYLKGILAQHITIRHWKLPLPFDHLERIIIDNPKIENMSYFNDAYNEITSLMHKQSIHVPLEIRKCDAECNCVEKYQSYKEGFTYHRFKTQA